MTLLDVRQRFVESSGRRDLVVDLTDYADSGADWYINRGQRYLDRVQPRPGSKKWYHADIATGGAQILVPDLRAVLDGRHGGVWVTDADGNAVSEKAKYKLEKKDVEWIRENYALSDSGLDTGRPLFYCNRAIQTASREIVANGKFISGTSVWTISSGWTVASGALTGSNVTGDVTQSQANQKIPYGMKVGKKYLVVYTIESFAAGSVAVSIDDGDTYGTTRSSNGTFIEVLEPDSGSALATILFHPVSAFTGVIKNFSVKEVATYETERLIGSHYEGWRGITLMPPSDGAYTISLLGLFYSPTLSEDYDTSFWTEEHPDILIAAANRELEVFYRNSEGRRDWEAEIHEKLFGIEKDEIEQGIAGISYMGDR
jgi:hypothetical protein